MTNEASLTSEVLGRRDLFAYGKRLVWLAAPAAVLATSSRAQESNADGVKRLGAKLFCACGCGQILTACNHVGCTYSSKMLAELSERIARGDSDDVILQSFVQEYGLTVLAQPPAKGFNILVWILPVVLPLVALIAVWGLVQRWREHARLQPAVGPVDPALLSRAHQEAGDDE